MSFGYPRGCMCRPLCFQQAPTAAWASTTIVNVHLKKNWLTMSSDKKEISNRSA